MRRSLAVLVLAAGAAIARAGAAAPAPPSHPIAIVINGAPLALQPPPLCAERTARSRPPHRPGAGAAVRAERKPDYDGRRLQRASR